MPDISNGVRKLVTIAVFKKNIIASYGVDMGALPQVSCRTAVPESVNLQRRSIKFHSPPRIARP